MSKIAVTLLLFLSSIAFAEDLIKNPALLGLPDKDHPTAAQLSACLIDGLKRLPNVPMGDLHLIGPMTENEKTQAFYTLYAFDHVNPIKKFKLKFISVGKNQLGNEGWDYVQYNSAIGVFAGSMKQTATLVIKNEDSSDGAFVLALEVKDCF